MNFITQPVVTGWVRSRRVGGAAACYGRRVKSDEERARRVLTWGALVTAVGIAVSGTVSPATGGFILVAGWAIAAFGIHSYGRAGG